MKKSSIVRKRLSAKVTASVPYDELSGSDGQPPEEVEVNDVSQFFNGLPGVSYAVLDSDGAYAGGPTVGSAVDLVWDVVNGFTY